MSDDSVVRFWSTWKGVATVITSTAAAIVVIYQSVTWFQPAALADLQHAQMKAEFEAHAESTADDYARQSLEAELERVELLIKMLNDRAERRSLTPDEQEELEYARERRRQIRARLYGE